MFMDKVILILLVSFVIFVNCDVMEENNDFLVTGPNGIMRGEWRDNFIAFEGIPYAEPPIGENRFEIPKALTSQWEGIRNTTHHGNACMQWHHFIADDDKLTGNEDCLFLNIYTRKLKPNTKYPVIFYIHAGGFTYGSSDEYGPENLLQRPVIYVNINYRLGPLGFLSTEDDNIAGNMGLKDQALALKWVKENIERFGGDSNKITITGYSAGAASVHFHYLSPLSTGLFTNGISHSGSALNPWVITEKAGEKAKKLAHYLGCPTCCNIRMTECLKQKPAEDIVRAVKLFQPWLYNPFTPFGPVIETASDHAFLSESPLHILKKGKFQFLPWLASAVESEGLYPGADFVKNENLLPELETKWHQYAPYILDFNDTVPINKQSEFSDSVKQHYLKGKQISLETYPLLIKMMSDRLFIVGLQKSVELQSKKSNSSVYFYFYKNKLTYGVAQALSQNNDYNFGVSHGDDTLLIYQTEIRGKSHPYMPDEVQMQNKLLDLYYNYAKNGELKFGDLSFEPINVTTDEFKYMEIINSNEAIIKTNNDLGHYHFWQNIPFN